MPAGPEGPAGPVAPLAPTAPVNPVGPGSPFGPCRPVSPFGPCAPAGSWPALKSEASREPFATLTLVTAFLRILAPATAFFFSCAAPTEFLATTRPAAAWPSGVEPTTATASAVAARIVAVLAEEVVVLVMRFTVRSFRSWAGRAGA